MATTKPKTAVKKTTAKSKAAAAKKPVAKSKTAASKKPVSTVKLVAAPAKTKTKKVEKKGIFEGFFAKKYDADESILTIFKKPNLYGAMIGEIIGVLVLTLVLMALSFFGIYNAAIYVFAFIAITVAVFAFSGAHLNPIITVGMMATRRISVVRGVVYIVAQVIGAWLGWSIFNIAFVNGGEAGYAVPSMSAVAEGGFWAVTMIELLGAILLGFFFARALTYKRSVFTFAAVVAGGLVAAAMVGYIISYAFFGLSNNFIFNPAVALMYQIFPTAGASFGEIFGGICSALATYVLFPMIGGVIGFYIADFASKLSGENA